MKGSFEGCFYPYDMNAALAKVPFVLADVRSVQNKPCPTFGKCLRVPFLTEQRVEEDEVVTLPTETNQVFAN